DAQQRVGIRMLRVELVVGVVVEVDVAVGACKDCLILAAALRVETRLERVRADDLRDVVNEVERMVLIDKRQPVEIYARKSLIVDAAKPEVRQVAKADTGKKLRHIDVV